MMRQINAYSHIPFLHAGLMKLIPKDSFSWRMRRAIGAEINAFMEYEDDVYDSENYSGWFPVKTLFLWIKSNKEDLVLEWLSNEDGEFFDDTGERIALSVPVSLSGVEQLAAFGLWFLDVEMEICGSFSDEDYDENRVNPHGWKEVEVLNHKAECLLNAYQALTYAERLSRGTLLSADENEKTQEIDFVAMRARADERHRLSKNALDIKNEPNRRARIYVRSEWEKNRSAYGGNKSEFARTYVPIVANNFVDAKGDPFKITEKQMKEVWLSDTQLTRKPAR